jgi:SSS family transporter
MKRLKFAIFSIWYIAFLHSLAGSDIETQLSIITSDMPYAAEGAVVTQVDNALLVLGGQQDGEWLSRAALLNADENTWQEVDLPFAVRNAASTSDTSRAWIAGGKGPDGSSRAVWELSANAETALAVTSLPDLPVDADSPAIIEYNEFLYFAAEQPNSTNILLRLDLRDLDNDWEALPLWSNTFLENPVFGIQNGELFISGQDPKMGTAPIWRLKDPRHTSWTPRTPAPFGLYPCNGIASGHSSLLFMGSAAPSEKLRLLAYNVITDKWVSIGEVADAYDAYFKVQIGQRNYLATIHNDGSGTLYELIVGMASQPFGWIDYSIVILYICVLVIMGFYFSRREKGSNDYFVGGRKVPWWAVGVSLYATGTSAISFMAISGRTYSSDWLYFTSIFFGLVLAALVALLLVPLLRKLNIVSTYEYLELRFHVSVRLIGSIILMLTQLGSRMSVVLLLPALALSKVTGINVVESVIAMGIIATLYTYMGGIKAVIWTDVVQVFILLGGAFFCLFYIVTQIDGGVVGFITTANAYDKLQVFDWRLTLEAATVWVFFLAAFAGIMTIPNDQVMMQRVLSTKDEKAAGRSIWTLTLITIPGNLVFFALGTALWVFYANFPERMDPTLQFDATFPHFIAHEFPVGLAGLVISALFAASMSTLDSGMNSVATVFSIDFYKRFKPSATDGQILRVARIITLLSGAFATGMALILTRYSLPSLWDTMILLTGLIGGGFGGVFALGMFTRRANTAGAICGVIASLVTGLSAQAFTNVHVFMILPIAVFTVVSVGYAVSWLTPRHSNSLHGLTLYRVDQTPRPE